MIRCAETVKQVITQKRKMQKYLAMVNTNASKIGI